MVARTPLIRNNHGITLVRVHSRYTCANTSAYVHVRFLRSGSSMQSSAISPSKQIGQTRSTKITQITPLGPMLPNNSSLKFRCIVESPSHGSLLHAHCFWQIYKKQCVQNQSNQCICTQGNYMSPTKISIKFCNGRMKDMDFSQKKARPTKALAEGSP